MDVKSKKKKKKNKMKVFLLGCYGRKIKWPIYDLILCKRLKTSAQIKNVDKSVPFVVRTGSRSRFKAAENVIVCSYMICGGGDLLRTAIT